MRLQEKFRRTGRCNLNNVAFTPNGDTFHIQIHTATAEHNFTNFIISFYFKKMTTHVFQQHDYSDIKQQ
jgi:hypothetical protein